MLTTGWFLRLCAGLDTPGGHMIFCLVLISTGALMCKIGLVEEGKPLIAGAGGAALMAMRGLNGSKPQAPPPPPPATP